MEGQKKEYGVGEGEGAGLSMGKWYGLIETDRLEMGREGGVRKGMEEGEKRLHNVSKRGEGSQKRARGEREKEE